MPVTSVGDNLIYKYLDSNLFAVSTLNKKTQKLSVFILNGISGKIVYKFQHGGISIGDPIDMFLSENYLIVAFKRASKSLGSLP